MAKTKVRKPRGNSALDSIKKALRDLPKSVAHDAAGAAAPEITGLTRTAFASDKNVYGDPRGLRYPSATGKPLTLVKSGRTRDRLGFKQAGTIIRCVMSDVYQKYLIGKYGILPNGAMPASWERRLLTVVDGVVKRDITRALGPSR